MLNEVLLQGRMTKDPELKTTQSGKSVCSFTIAVERDYSSDNEKQTDFINIVAWKNQAEFVSKYFPKGKMILVRGSLQVRKYTTQNGENRSVTEVVAERVYFAGDNSKTAQSGNNGTTGDSFTECDVTVDADLPF